MPALPQNLVRAAVIAYLVVQAAALVGYWCVLLLFPSSRVHFVPPASSDSALLAFAIADLALYLPLSILAAFGLVRRSSWSWPVLWAHAGASVYPTLYALMLWILEPTRWLGAAMMAPALVVSPLLVWLFRPRDP